MIKSIGGAARLPFSQSKMRAAIQIIIHKAPYLAECAPAREWIAKANTVDLTRYGESWQEAANQAAASEGLILFANNAALFDEPALAALIEALATDDNLAGAYPVFVDKSGSGVTHLGYVSDSQTRLCSLYEGMGATNPLIGKRRKFQLASSAALLIRAEDFQAIGGFRPDLAQICFFDLCKRLAQRRQSGFAAIPGATAIYENDIEALAVKGIWDSLALRGKLPPGILRPDLAENLARDGIGLAVTPWLCERPDLKPGKENAWLEWRYNPCPNSLLRWLADLAPAKTREAIAICREFPAILPAQFRQYEILASKILAYAEKNRLPLATNQLKAWQRRAKAFHYGELRRGMTALKNAGMYNASLDRAPAVFDAWIELSPPNERPALEAQSPMISIVMPVYNPEPHFLREAIQSVLDQDYGNWELCIADDKSEGEETARILKGFAKKDNCVKLVFREENGHIARATNSAIAIASGDWIAFMDQDDLLAKEALAKVAAAIHHNPGVRLVFTDEDHIDPDNLRRSPIFKQGTVCPLSFILGHLLVLRKSDIAAIGGFRPEYNGSQDYDLSLRILERLGQDEILHIPEILYHWRIHPDSTAGSSQTKPYVFEAAKKALEDFALRQGMKGQGVRAGMGSFHNILYEWPTRLKGAIVVYGQQEKISGLASALSGLLPQNARVEIIGRPHEAPVSRAIQGESGAPPSLEEMREAARGTRADVFLFLSANLMPVAGCRPEQLLILAALQSETCVGSIIWRNGSNLNGGFYPDVTGRLFPLLQGSDPLELRYFAWGELSRIHLAAAIHGATVAISRKALEKIQSEASDGHDGYQPALVSPWGQWELGQGGEAGWRFPEAGAALSCLKGLRNPNLKAAPDNDWTLILPD